VSLKTLLATLPQTGKLEWIGLRSEHRGAVKSVETAEVRAGFGLGGDHRAARKDAQPESKRHITLIQAEHLAVIAALSGHGDVDPALLRRNLVVAGINLLALKDQTFTVGDVILTGTGLCHPCSRMEEALGPGGYNAVRGHGGITAKIVRGGLISRGDPVRLCPDAPELAP
jgi:MOSC domain-containing protein YiiM